MIKLALAYVPQNARVLLAFIVLGSCVEADEILLCQWQGRNFWSLGVFSVQLVYFVIPRPATLTATLKSYGSASLAEDYKSLQLACDAGSRRGIFLNNKGIFNGNLQIFSRVRRLATSLWTRIREAAVQS